MTTMMTAMARVIIGYVGPTNTNDQRKTWNDAFAKQGTDAFFDFYRIKDIAELQLRLSEMHVLGRRGYIVAPEFAESVIPLLDSLEEGARQSGSVNTIVNERGVLHGYWLVGAESELRAARWKLWF